MGVSEGKHKGNRYFYVRILWELSQFFFAENIFISLSFLKEICQSFGFISVLTVAPMNVIYLFSLTVLNILISLCLHKFCHDAPSFCFVFFWGGVYVYIFLGVYCAFWICGLKSWIILKSSWSLWTLFLPHLLSPLLQNSSYTYVRPPYHVTCLILCSIFSKLFPLPFLVLILSTKLPSMSWILSWAIF